MFQHPSTILHYGLAYDLIHLREHFLPTTWREGAADRSFMLRVRYADHCYSDGDLPQLPGCAIIKDQHAKDRAFCPLRHAHSLALPGIIAGLAAKPSTFVGFTIERNWQVFRLLMKPDPNAGLRYCLFFMARRSILQPVSGAPVNVDLDIRSAYVKTNQVKVLRNLPFGQVVTDASKRGG